MVAWVIFAIGGGVICLVGFHRLYRRYQTGRLNLASLIAYAVGLICVAVYTLLSAFKPEVMTSAVTLLTLVPAIAALAVIVHCRGKSVKQGEIQS